MYQTAHDPWSIADQVTGPLPRVVVSNNLEFLNYLKRHGLTRQSVALAADVRQVTIWSIEHGLPISRKHAIFIYRSLYWLTGEPFRGTIQIRREDMAWFG